ncbi:MAG: ABC transporter transmembrane domain-containing protein [Myxococcota bacterium]
MTEKTPSALRRILALVRPYMGRFLLACVFLFLGSGIGLVYPQAVRFAVDEGLAEGSFDRLDQVGLALIVLFLVQAIFTWWRHYLMSWLGERAVADVRRRVMDRLVKLPPGWFHQRRTGELVGRISGDVTILEGAVGSELSLSLRNSVQLIGGIVLLFVVDVKLTLIMLAIVPPLTITIMVFGRRIRSMSRKVQDAVADTNARVQEVFGAIATVQAFRQEGTEASRYGDGVEVAFGRAVRLARWRATFMATSSLAGFLAIGVIIWVGGRRVAVGDMSAGSLTAFLLYTTIVAVALASLTSLWAALMRAAGATQRLFEIIETVPEIRNPETPTRLPFGKKAFRLEDVTFRYPSRPDLVVLDDVTLEIAPGETVALVGPSGAGKSTLTALLPRFYDPLKGRITFGGVDLRELDLEDLRGAISMVPQDPVLFSGTIAENIAYGEPNTPNAQIEAAAKAANAHEFVLSFPEGYNTLCGERGVQLSGGQRQRIALARALLADPALLILDEATSSLDAESEAAIQQALAEATKSRTTLIIAHRLSTVRDADRIVVMEGGRIVESGRHEALMEEAGLYRRLVEHQLSAA